MRACACVAFAFAFALAGCRQNVDLAALAALDATVAETQRSFADLSDDFRASCLRTVGWLRASQPGTSPDAAAACAEEARAARQWQAANAVVTAYVAALGHLAGRGDASGDDGLGELAHTLAALGVTKTFTPAQQHAVTTAASSLVNDYFDAKRRAALGPIVTRADADLATIVTTLEDVARSNYATQLTTERLAVQLFFEPALAQARTGGERLQALASRAAERNEQQQIDARQGAIDPYVAALENIRTTHAQIARAIASDRLGDVASIVQAYVATYEPHLAALRKAFR